jgi:hypothetical protein
VSSNEKCDSERSDEIQKLLKEIKAIRNNNAEKENAIETLEREKKFRHEILRRRRCRHHLRKNIRLCVNLCLNPCV